MYNDFYNEPLISQHYAINQLVDSKVITAHGPMNIFDLNPNDIVYEYGTSNPIRVRGITRCDPQPIYEIRYTDGRTMKVPEYEMIYTGRDIHQLHLLKDVMDSFIFDELQPCIINFNEGKVVKPFRNDPYLVGALITYGDWNIPYINLPLWKPEISEYFCNSDMVEYGGTIHDSKVLFKWRWNSSDQPITWIDFLPYQCYSVTKRLDNDMFPIEYVIACTRDRLKFIRGIFDVGYDHINFPDKIGIAHYSEFRLKEIQKILWTVGILSRISYDPNLSRANSWQSSENMRWRLDILGKDHKIYPGMFYDIDNITYMIDDNRKLVDIERRNNFRLKIESIQECITSGYMYNIVTEDPCRVYVTDNYLPRVSSI